MNGPSEGRLDGSFLRDYATATGDPSAPVLSGTVVPPVSLVTQIWEAQNKGRSTVGSDVPAC